MEQPLCNVRRLLEGTPSSHVTAIISPDAETASTYDEVSVGTERSKEKKSQMLLLLPVFALDLKDCGI